MDQIGRRFAWLICPLGILAVLAIGSVIVLALIPLYLPTSSAHISGQKRATIIYDLPNQIDADTVIIRHGYLSMNQKLSFEQLLNNKLKSSAQKHLNSIAIIDAMVDSTTLNMSLSNKMAQTHALNIRDWTKRQIHNKASSVRLNKKNSSGSIGVTSELHVDFTVALTIDCLKRCRTHAIRYILDVLFVSVDIDSKSYLAMFADSPVTTESTMTSKVTISTETTVNTTLNATDSPLISTSILSTVSTMMPDNLTDHIISALNNISVFPSGSYTALLSSFGQASDTFNLLPLNDTVLFGIVSIDNSSLIFESGRQQFLYFLLPAEAPQQSRRITGLALRFGQITESDSVIIVPLPSTNRVRRQQMSYITVVYNMPDGTLVVRLQLTSPASMCSLNGNSPPDACVPVNVIARSVVDNNQVSSPLSSTVNAACGDVCSLSSSLCAASCTTCDGQQVSGADTPVSRRYNIGSKSAQFQFDFDTFVIKDRIKVWNGAILLFDTGCVGSANTTYIKYTNTSSDIRVDVEPNCDCGNSFGCTGTQWNFLVHCPKVCSAVQRNIPTVSIQSGATAVNSGDTLWIDQNSVMPPLQASLCAPVTTVTWSISFTYQASFNGATAFASPIITGVSDENNVFNITAALGNKVYGGSVSAKWSASASSTVVAQSGEVNFKILGRQPDQSAIVAYIESLNGPWFAKQVAMVESYGGTQFERGGSGYPLAALDNGYGIYQLTTPKPKYEQLFGWKQNVDEGIRRLRDKQGLATAWMARQRSQAGNVTVPNQKVANCLFTNSNITDAVAIKAYNGADLGNYCAWDNINKVWKFNPVNSAGRNYVSVVCRQPM